MKSTLARRLKQHLKRRLYKNAGLIITRPMQYLGRERLLYPSGDYIRESSLELVAEEIYAHNVSGSVSELGVYRGDFAACINTAFNERKFYMFDTFEGFNENDKPIEINNKFSLVAQDFTNTSVDLVLAKMRYPDNIIIRKGYFPSTLLDRDEGETFAFVSLDADLYKPTYEGLCFFYPRLSRGGYMFVHDYNNKHYAGVKAAVKQYCNENALSYFPLTDTCGTAVIAK